MPQPTPQETLARGVILKSRDGQYRIERVIGSGGYASVYKALDMTLNVERAVKEVTDPDEGVREQFRLEARLLINYHHANIPRGYYVFELNKRIYFVMDFVDGKDLEELLNESLTQQHRPLDEARVLRWMIEICSALTFIHRLPTPIIHRDIKPANIKITPEDRPVLIDFGLAKLQRDPARAAATQAAAQGVSPGFAPPEQYMAKGRTDARTDVYGLGATLYACLTGKDPAEAPARLLAQTGVSHGSSLEPPRALNSRISPTTERVILKALELSPSKRQQSADELEHDLRDALNQLIAMTAGGDTLTMPHGVAPRAAQFSPLNDQTSGRRPVAAAPPPVAPVGPMAQGAKAPLGAPVAQLARGAGAARGAGKPPAAPGSMLDPRTVRQPAAALAPQATQIAPVAPAAPAPQPLPAGDTGAMRTLAAAQNGAGARSSGKHPVAPSKQQQNGAAGAHLLDDDQPLMAMTGSHHPVLQLKTPGAAASAAGAAGAVGVGVATAERDRSGKMQRVSAKGAAIAAPVAAPKRDPRAWIALGVTPISGFGKWMLTLSAIEAIWGAVALSLGVISIVNHGLPSALLIKLGLGWLVAVVILSLLGGQALSRPVYRRGALGGLRRGMQGTGLFVFSVLVHAVALWGATIFIASPGNELLAVIAYIIFGLNVLAAGALSVFNILD